MRKRMFSLCMSLILCFSLLPAAATAAGGDGEEPAADAAFYVGGLALTGSAEEPAYATTDEDGQVTLGGSEDNYNVKWDGATLTLNGAKICGGYAFVTWGQYQQAAAIYSGDALQLVLEGENTIHIASEEELTCYGIYACNDITISGGGALAITVAARSSTGIYSDGGGITIAGGELTVAADGGHSIGIESIWDGIAITGGSLAITAAGEYSEGIYSSMITITGGELTATGETSSIACSILIDPQAGQAIQVLVGQDAGSARKIAGAPFDAQQEIPSVRDKKYFHSEVVAPAAGPRPNLYIGGVELYGGNGETAYATTDEKGQVTLGGSEDNYNIKWDGATLTLNDAKIQEGYVFTVSGRQTALFSEVSFEMVLVGTNAISTTGTDDIYLYNIYASDDLTISGNGTLASVANGKFGRGVFASGDFTISDGAVLTSIANGMYSRGIYAGSDLIIDSGQVTASGDNGIIVDGDFTISGDGMLNVKGMDEEDSYGLGVVGTVTIAGGEVTATGSRVGVYTNGGIIVAPELGMGIAVMGGRDAGSAAAMEGSPFLREEAISTSDKYFHSEPHPYTPAESVTLDKTTLNLMVGDSETLTAGVDENATYRTVTWSSSNPSVATVDENGLVTAVGGGSAVITAAAADGGKTAACIVACSGTDEAGNTIETVIHTDGSITTAITKVDGSSSATVADESGKVVSQVTLSQEAVSSAQARGEAAALPMPQVPVTTDRGTAPAVTVTLPAAVQVEVPVADVTPGTVAVLVKADGSEAVIKTSLTTENGVAVTLSDGDTVKIVDNSKDFTDVPETHWGAQAVDFVSSRELFLGTSATTFSPDTAMKRAMIVTVLARFDGVDTETGDPWYEAGRQWAMENGISDGTNMDQNLTREQLAAMLWRYAGSPSATADMSGYTDADSISDWAQQAMTWCVEQGIIGGTTSTTLSPQGEGTRAQVAAMLQRFCQ